MTSEAIFLIVAAVAIFAGPFVCGRITRRLAERRRARERVAQMTATIREAHERMMERFDRAPPWARQDWQRPIPHGANCALWEDVHTFAPGGKPKRDPYAGLCHGDPPLSLRCPICEADQAPIHHSGETRKCVYCGLTMKTHGSRLFWWREPSTVTVEWTAFIQRGTRS